MKHLLAAIALASLPACMAETVSKPATTAVPTGTAALLSGKTLSSSESTFTIWPDGRVTGREASGAPIAGTWRVTNGQWCRTLTAPAMWAGTSCRDVAVSGNQVTLTRSDGTGATYTMS